MTDRSAFVNESIDLLYRYKMKMFEPPTTSKDSNVLWTTKSHGHMYVREIPVSLRTAFDANV